MQLKMFLVLVMCLFSLSKAYVYNAGNPPFGKCDERIVSGIKALWMFTGKPTGVLQKMQEDGQYYLHQTSYDYLNFGNKCVFMDGSKDNSTLTFTFVPKIEVFPTGVLTYNMKEDDDGSMYDEVRNMRWYTIALAYGLEINYVCSATGGSPLLFPLGSIFIAKKRAEFINESMIGNFRSVLAGYGINFIYKYGLDSGCF